MNDKKKKQARAAYQSVIDRICTLWAALEAPVQGGSPHQQRKALHKRLDQRLDAWQRTCDRALANGGKPETISTWQLGK